MVYSDVIYPIYIYLYIHLSKIKYVASTVVVF